MHNIWIPESWPLGETGILSKPSLDEIDRQAIAELEDRTAGGRTEILWTGNNFSISV